MELCPGLGYLHLQAASVSKCQCGKSRTVAGCVLYRLGCWGELGARMQRVSVHLSGLTPSSWWADFGVCTFVLGRGERGLSWQQHMRSTWLLWCPGFAGAQQNWQGKVALLLNMLQWGNQKENSCLKQYMKKLLRDLKNRKMQVSNPSVEITVWLHLLYLQRDLTNRNFVLDV